MGWNVNSLYSAVNTFMQHEMTASSQDRHIPPNITVVRRMRLLELLNIFIRTQVSLGHAAHGQEQAFAGLLQVSPSLLSQIKKSRPISDKLARQIEKACDVPPGWLDDADAQPITSTPAEEAFVAQARAAWREANARQKRALVQIMKIGPARVAELLKTS